MRIVVRGLFTVFCVTGLGIMIFMISLYRHIEGGSILVINESGHPLEGLGLEFLDNDESEMPQVLQTERLAIRESHKVPWGAGGIYVHFTLQGRVHSGKRYFMDSPHESSAEHRVVIYRDGSLGVDPLELEPGNPK